MTVRPGQPLEPRKSSAELRAPATLPTDAAARPAAPPPATAAVTPATAVINPPAAIAPAATPAAPVTPTPAAADLSARDARQRDLVPPAALARTHAVVVGVGAVGRQVAVQLAAIGVPRMTLIDPDTVNVENLAPQAYWPEDVGRRKVEATAALCRTIHPACHVDAVPERFRRSMARPLAALAYPDVRPAVFACVDSIEARGLVWGAVRTVAGFFADARMAAEVIRVLAAAPPATDDHYAGTLFAPERAYAGACTARSTVYAASIAAGLMLAQFAKWLRGLPVDRDLTLNLLAAELTAG